MTGSLWLPGPSALILSSFLSGCGTAASNGTGSQPMAAGHPTALFSKTSNGYVRPRNADGSLKTETYVLKDGGDLGGPRTDATIDNATFSYISDVVGVALSTAGYQPSTSEREPDLLIICYRGTTVVPDDIMPRHTRPSDMSLDQANKYATTAIGRGNNASADSNARQDQFNNAAVFSSEEADITSRIDAQNANILGYTGDIERTTSRNPYMITLKSEVESDRYYVVLLAYDYDAMTRFRIRRLLWESRISIAEVGTDFEKALPNMVAIASKYFGQDSDGLVRHDLAEGHVEIGKITNLGAVPDK